MEPLVGFAGNWRDREKGFVDELSEEQKAVGAEFIEDKKLRFWCVVLWDTIFY